MFLFVFSAALILGRVSAGEEDAFSLMSAYYDPATKHQLRITSIENVLRNNMTDDYNTKSTFLQRQKIIRRISFRSNGCTCQNLVCGCCLGINLNAFNFKREGCMNFTYDPDDFSVSMNMFFDNNNIYSNSFSAKNPPPLCLPVPIPYIPLQVEACAKVFDVYLPGQNLHLCLDFETRIQQATVLILHFNCMRLGVDGVALLKPEDGGGLPHPTQTEIAVEVPSDIYDDVTEIKYVTKDG